MLSCRDMAPWLSTHSAPACGGKVVAPAAKGGRISNARQGGCMVFAAKGGIKMAPERALTSPAQRYYIPPESGALNPPVRRSRSQAEPWQPRAERPGGWLNPHARKGVSTFGNTGKHRLSPDPDRAIRRLNPQSPKGLVFPSMTPRSLYPPAPRSSSLAASLARSSMA